MKIHKLYMADEYGGYSGYDRLQVFVKDGVLHIGNQLTIPTTDIGECGLVPVAKGKFALDRRKHEFIGLTACSPSVNGGQPTVINLIYVGFLMGTSVRKMQEFVNELAPLIKDNSLEKILARQPTPSTDEPPEGKYQIGYALNVSLVVACYRKTWFSFDSPGQALVKTYSLMLVGSVCNLFGVLLVAVPFDNWNLSMNLIALGRSRSHQIAVYLSSLLIPIAFWSWLILH